jgi:hypothetical protein
VAALITALVGVGGLVLAARGGGAPGAPTADHASVPATSRGDAPATGEPAADPGGELELGDGDTADLDRGVVGTSVSDADVALPMPYLTTLDQVVLASAGTQPATARSCRALLARRRDVGVDLTEQQPGNHVCVSTSQGRIGVLRLTALPGPGNTALRFTVTLF